MLETTANVFKFSELCAVFDEVSSAKSPDKANILSDFITMYRTKSLDLLKKEPEASDSFYPVLRLILPKLERERPPYGLKESMLCKRLISILSLPINSADTVRLAAFRQNSTNSNIKDFADAAYWTLRKYFSSSKGLTVAEINTRLDMLAQCHANSDPRGVDSALLSLLQNTSPDEQRWLIRIILKEVHLGMGEDRILKIYHPDAADLYNINNSILKVCMILKDPSVQLHEIEIEMFSPFRPMLSQRMDVKPFKKSVDGNRLFYIETKFDGERFQLHMEHGVFKYFSRNGYDYTDTYGSTFESGLYTPLLKDVFSKNVARVILDGEMMGWNKRTKKLGSKGMAFDVKKLTRDSIHQPCFCVFDVLLLNNKVLTNRPLKERLQLLNAIFKPIEGTIMKSKYHEATSKETIIEALNRSMDKEEEGIVFKDAESVYKANDRNAGWYKMKLEYFEGVMSDLDVIIIGGYYGDRQNWSYVDSFLIAVAVPPTNGPNPTIFHSFGRIATGLSVDERKLINDKLRPYWKKINEGDPVAAGLLWTKEKPDVWIPPEKSCILLVRGTELTRTKDFKANYTLRFPRILKIRTDKPYYDCLTTLELLELTSSSQAIHKLSKRHLDLSDLEEPVKQKVPKYPMYGSDLPPIEVHTQVLEGYEFFVLTGTTWWSKEDVETAIRKNGGSIVRIERLGTLCILVGDMHSRVKISQDQKADTDIVKLQWLKKVLDSKNFTMYSPTDMLHTSLKTAHYFLDKYDKYGDSYTEDATLESLTNSLDMVKACGDYANLMAWEMKALDVEMKFSNPLDAYRGKTAYFDNYKVVNDMCSPEIYKSYDDEIKFMFLGGLVSSILNSKVDYVVIDCDISDKRKDMVLECIINVHNDHACVIENTSIRREYEALKLHS